MVLAVLATLVTAAEPNYSVVVTRRLGVSPELAANLANDLATALNQNGARKLGTLIRPTTATARLVTLGLPESTVCNGGAACVSTLARVLDTQHLVAVQLVKVGSDIAVDVSLVARGEARSLAAVTRTTNGQAASREMQAIARELVALLPDLPPEPEAVKEDKQKAPEVEPPVIRAPQEAALGPEPLPLSLRAELMPSFIVSSPQSSIYGAGLALRAQGLLTLSRFVDVGLSAGYGAWSASPDNPFALGASMVTIGAGARLRRPYENALVVPMFDANLSWVLTGPISSLLNDVGLNAGASVLFRGNENWPVLIGPVMRFDYVVKVQSEPGYPHFNVAFLSIGVAVEFSPTAGHASAHAANLLDDDADRVPNVTDLCPSVPGLPRFEGCPEDDPDVDGVRGAGDACPLMPGLPTLNGCPDDDLDGDGVRGVADGCPKAAGPAELNGCPSDDRDGDGVRGVSDLCPDKTGKPEDNGCPRTQFVKVTEKKLELLQKILFAFGKTTILPRSTDLLNEVVQVLVDNPTFCVRIEGHTDNIGSPQKNKELSQGRADEVRSFVTAAGVAASRMYSVGYGQEIPRDTNANADGRENNRRVEFVFVNCSAPELRTKE